MNGNGVFNVDVVEFAALETDRVSAAVGGVVNGVALQQAFDDTQMFCIISDPHR